MSDILRLFSDGKVFDDASHRINARFRIGQCWQKQTRTQDYEVCDALVTFDDGSPPKRCHIKAETLDTGARCKLQRLGFGSAAAFGLIGGAS